MVNLGGAKLNTIESEKTRPTLDRVKESLFNIIQNRIKDSIVLDLFAGSGALGIESISRGAKKAYYCDNSIEAINVIKKNIEKTKQEDQSIVLKMNYTKCLDEFKEKDVKFDIIYIDPPYELDIAAKSIKQIIDFHLLQKDGIIILETDEEDREIKELKDLDIEIYDIRRYGRIVLLFLHEGS